MVGIIRKADCIFIRSMAMVEVILEKGNNIFFLHVPFEQKDRAKKVGGVWSQEKKMWKFAFDSMVWKNIYDEFGADIKASPLFYFLLSQKEKEQKVFMSYKDIAEKDEPIDYEVDGISLNGKNPFFNYQKHGVKCGLSVGDGFLIGDTMGLGKTIQAMGIALARKKQGEINNCLIVCPASLKYNWLDEIAKFTKEKALVIDGDKEERTKRWIAQGYFFKIVNYEAVARDLFHDTKKEEDSRISCWSAVVNNMYDFVIVDEIQAIKNHSALRTKALKKLKCAYRVGLSGTPIDGRLEELHSIFDFLKPGLFPCKSKFMERHAILDYYGAVQGYQHTQEVRDKISPYYLRRLKSLVLKDLPEKMFKDVYVELSDKEYKEYKNLVKRKHEITSESMAAVAIIRARQFCDFPELLGLRNPSAKYSALVELLEELIKQNKEKVVIFTQYKQALDLLFLNLKGDYKILQIHGDVPAKDRVELCKQFNDDPSVNIILMTDAGCTGLNLQEGNAVVHYDDNYSPSIMQQRNDRCILRDELVEMEKHRKQKIQDIKVGDLVLTHKGKYHKVLRVIKTVCEDDYRIGADIFFWNNDKKISLTSDHPVLVLKDTKLMWTEVGNLLRDDAILKPVIKGEKLPFNQLDVDGVKYWEVKITNIDFYFLKKGTELYDLEVEEDHSFIVDMIAVHNCHRATTKHVVTIYRFICKDTIEERVREILAKKMIVNNSMLEENCDEFIISGISSMDLLSCL